MSESDSESDSQMCKYNKCDLCGEPCLACLADYVKIDIFKRLLNDHEGELTEMEFHDLVNDVIKHEELDDEVNRLSVCDTERLVCEYGIGNAIQLMIDNYGAMTEAPNTKTLLYVIINEHYLHDIVSFQNYNDWLVGQDDD
jgi:hypothetical protein